MYIGLKLCVCDNYCVNKVVFWLEFVFYLYNLYMEFFIIIMCLFFYVMCWLFCFFVGVLGICWFLLFVILFFEFEFEFGLRVYDCFFGDLWDYFMELSVIVVVGVFFFFNILVFVVFYYKWDWW